ncbi:MAG: hypothetical protein ACOYOU_10445 [Kiritimatiellia bacterium]
MANAHGISGLGIDISPHFIAAARKRQKTCAHAGCTGLHG